jgi:hypothetical protein
VRLCRDSRSEAASIQMGHLYRRDWLSTTVLDERMDFKPSSLKKLAPAPVAVRTYYSTSATRCFPCSQDLPGPKSKPAPHPTSIAPATYDGTPASASLDKSWVVRSSCGAVGECFDARADQSSHTLEPICSIGSGLFFCSLIFPLAYERDIRRLSDRCGSPTKNRTKESSR